MNLKNFIGVLGFWSIVAGVIGLMFGLYQTFLLIVFGLGLAVIIMFWGTSGKFQEILDKHTGAYDHELRKSPKDTSTKLPDKRKW